ncbi:type I restriction endonuclease subunit R [Polaribacter glomeratus]|uniref:Type I restriction enzyme endonuclease subunit n=1 Tax=Polaribacter glomeratus TaxID=102 RepID=A0A2S7WV02_9FLAO|nr:type I restriction endonuclease subunit R [Polaribacter glomeratus]PQJ81306.1 deoxyribonuclease HsdR [Polaribacter glomeratus]TXD64079.1 type I restriction endonuclease subunit R [Polaribacter glomeratus]
MSKQSELQLENNLIKQLVGLGYTNVTVVDGDALLLNLKTQLETFNDCTFSEKEFETILNHLAKGSVFDKAKTLRGRFQFLNDADEPTYIRFFNSENHLENKYQVSNQITQEGTYKNRYDVTLLVNGLPLVQIELKRRGLEIKEAFNQINRYQKHSFWSNHGLFQYVQLFIISNGVNTKYLANNELQSVKQTFFWSDEANKNIRELVDFTNAFLNTNHLGLMIAKYIVRNQTHKILMVLRPYQFYAVEKLVAQVQNTTDNAYIWHTTGSGKTLTSFKASQIIMDLPAVDKVLFVVDRKDLDYQTMKEFNSFKKDSVDVTKNTDSLVKQLADESKLVLTTIQKLNNAISKNKYEKKLSVLKNKRVVIIFDECHRSQFGDTHKLITDYFVNCQLFGFTGTPIFADNASKNDLGKRTTKDLFGNCLHKYVITDAIADDNVLKFGIEYIGRYKQKGKTLVDIQVEDINKSEVFYDENRLEKIADYIIAYHGTKTFSKEYSALFAVSDIKTLIKYYDIFKAKKQAGLHSLRIATIFSYGANEANEDAQDYLPGDDYGEAAEPGLAYTSSHSREKLDEYIADYNEMYTTSFSTKDAVQFENYFKNISKRLKDRERKNFNDAKDRLDIVIVVNMMLTGFDAKKVNTLYVDKNLRHHGLIQAFSRTNRILGEKKSQGNIVCFRNLKKATDEAITLFSNKDANETIIVPPYENIAEKFDEALEALFKIAPTHQSVDDLVGEEQQFKFVQAFRRLLRAKNVLESYVDFNWEDLAIDEQTFENYKSEYLDVYEKVTQQAQTEKASILEDVDFELELIHRDEINVVYIIQLLAKIKLANTSEAQKQKKAIIDLLGGNIKLRSKRELIEKFIEENLPHIDNVDAIQDEFEKYWQQEKVLALAKICEEEHLDQKQFNSLIESYIYNGQEPIRQDVFKCLGNRPSILKAREIGERIIVKMKKFVNIFIDGMTG